jgi:peptidyl-prolyl cis-trans isomerase B (cyclophilin B)
MKPTATIILNNNKEILIELYPDIAPITVNNFISLANSQFYDGTIFHRVIKNFMVQGGDPEGTGIGGPGYKIKGEFNANGFSNELKHTRGIISMARSQDMNSAGSQFFIMHQDAPHLDGLYAAFGKVVSGIEEVDRIATVKTDTRDRPVDKQQIIKIVINFNGYNLK